MFLICAGVFRSDFIQHRKSKLTIEVEVEEYVVRAGLPKRS
jgi:hypothetical protein